MQCSVIQCSLQSPTHGSCEQVAHDPGFPCSRHFSWCRISPDRQPAHAVFFCWNPGAACLALRSHHYVLRLGRQGQGPIALNPSLPRPVVLLPVSFPTPTLFNPTSFPSPWALVCHHLVLPVWHKDLGFFHGGHLAGGDASTKVLFVLLRSILLRSFLVETYCTSRAHSARLMALVQSANDPSKPRTISVWCPLPNLR